MEQMRKIDLRTSEAAMLDNGHVFITVKRPVGEKPLRFYGGPGDVLCAGDNNGIETKFVLRVVSVFLVNDYLLMVLARQLSS